MIIAADERGELALAGAAAAAARAHELEQRRWLRDPFERVDASILRHKQSSDLPLHARRDQNRTRLGRGLHPRRHVGDVAENLACGVNHRRASFESDASFQLRRSATGVLAVQIGKCPLD
jgi:hypothetical protein